VATSAFEFKGARAFLEGLHALDVSITRAGSAALRAGAKPIIQAIKARAPQRYGLLRKAQGVVVGKAKGPKRTAAIGARKNKGKVIGITKDGKQRYADPAYYGHLVEGGTKSHRLKTVLVAEYTDKKGRNRKVYKPDKAARLHPGSRANPFKARAVQASKTQAVDAIRKSLVDDLKRATRARARAI